jgi:hypothetical protein
MIPTRAQVDLSHRAAHALYLLRLSGGITIQDERRFVQAVVAAESEEALPDWAKDIIQRAKATREKLLRGEF